MTTFAKQRRGQVGVNVAERVVLTEWRSRWQQVDGQNDDGIDGLIFLERRGIPTGQIIYVQVKCHQIKARTDGTIAVAINRDRLERNMQVWKRVVGAAILVHVDPETLIARWANVRDSRVVTPSQIIIHPNDLFDASARKIIANLCGNVHRDLLLPQINTVTADFPHFTEPHLQRAARRFYKALSIEPVYLGPTGPVVRFTREGWRHITRPDRPVLVRHQSLVLLGVIRKVLAQANPADLKDYSPRIDPTGDYVALRAVVTFSFRQTCVVKIVMRRRKDENKRDSYSFHTIYEPRRKRNVLGARSARGNT